MGKEDICSTVTKNGQSALDGVLSAPIPMQGPTTKEPARQATRKRLEVVRMSDVQPELIEWIWDGRIPRGCLTVLDGDPGLGKSTLVCELGECDLDANRLVGPAESEEARSALADACDFLRQALADGPLLHADVLERAGREGIKPGTLKRAKRELGVRSEKEFGEHGRWMWTLPTSAEMGLAPVAPLAPLSDGSDGGQQ